MIERRKVLHERTAQTFEALFPDRQDDHLSELALHYSRSDNTRKGLDFLERAGKQALHRSGFSEAQTHLSDRLELLRKLSDDQERERQELTLQIALFV